MKKIKRVAAALVLVGALGGSVAVPVSSTILAGDSWTYQTATVSPNGDSWT